MKNEHAKQIFSKEDYVEQYKNSLLSRDYKSAAHSASLQARKYYDNYMLSGEKEVDYLNYAIKWMKEALKYDSDNVHYGNCLRNYKITYAKHLYKLKEYEKSAEHFKDCLNNEKNTMEKEKNFILHSLGDCYQELAILASNKNDFDKKIENWLKQKETALQLPNSIDRQGLILKCNYHLANSPSEFLEKSKLSAIDLLKSNIELSNEINLNSNNAHLLVKSYSLLANILQNAGNVSEAISNYESSIKIAQKFCDDNHSMVKKIKNNLFMIYSKLAKEHFILNDYMESLGYCDKSLNVLGLVKNKSTQEIYRLQGEIYCKLGDQAHYQMNDLVKNGLNYFKQAMVAYQHNGENPTNDLVNKVLQLGKMMSILQEGNDNSNQFAVQKPMETIGHKTSVDHDRPKFFSNPPNFKKSHYKTKSKRKHEITQEGQLPSPYFFEQNKKQKLDLPSSNMTLFPDPPQLHHHAGDY